MLLSVDRRGSGEIPVVFLHGYCEGNWVWDDLIPHLPEEWTCWLIELPGFGKSDPIPEDSADVSMDDIGQIIWQELKRRDIRRPRIVGHSLGGYVALAMADANPEDISGVILFHSSPFADSAERQEIRNKVIASVRQYGPSPFLRTFADGLFREKGRAWRFFSSLTSGVSGEAISLYARLMRDRPDRSSLLQYGKVQVDVVAGRFDGLIPASVVGQIAGLHSSVRVSELTRSAHVGMLEEPVAAAAILSALIGH